MLHVLKQDPSIEIGGLLTTMNEQFDRVADARGAKALVERRQARRVCRSARFHFHGPAERGI